MFIKRSRWSRRHWKAFLERTGGPTYIRRALVMDDGSILRSGLPFPGTTMSEAAMMRMVRDYHPEMYRRYKEDSERIARLYYFFKRRIPTVVDCDCPYVPDRIAR